MNDEVRLRRIARKVAERERRAPHQLADEERSIADTVARVRRKADSMSSLVLSSPAWFEDMLALRRVADFYEKHAHAPRLARRSAFTVLDWERSSRR